MKEVLEDTKHQMSNLIDTVPGGIGIIEVSPQSVRLKMSYFNDGLSSMLDCDNDTILAKVRQVGAACHTGSRSCFFKELAQKSILKQTH